MKKRNLTQELVIIFWLFIFGSILGYIFEMIVALVQKGHFESRQGLIYGPFTPVYGVGIVIYYLILSNMDIQNKIKVFGITMVLGGITEYICSFAQERIFGTISWDYSNLMFNINGRTSLLHCIYWGTGGVLYAKYVIPIIEKFRNNFYENNKRIVTIIMSILIFIDISLSFIAANRQTERRNNIMPKNKVDLFLDKYYSDEYMDRVYCNKKEVSTKM